MCQLQGHWLVPPRHSQNLHRHRHNYSNHGNDVLRLFRRLDGQIHNLENRIITIVPAGRAVHIRLAGINGTSGINV